jgi:hypothetical protein
MGMRTRDKVRYANFIKKRIEFFIFTTPIRLYGKNFLSNGRSTRA